MAEKRTTGLSDCLTSILAIGNLQIASSDSECLDWICMTRINDYILILDLTSCERMLPPPHTSHTLDLRFTHRLILGKSLTSPPHQRHPHPQIPPLHHHPRQTPFLPYLGLSLQLHPIPRESRKPSQPIPKVPSCLMIPYPLQQCNGRIANLWIWMEKAETNIKQSSLRLRRCGQELANAVVVMHGSREGKVDGASLSMWEFERTQTVVMVM